MAYKKAKHAIIQKMRLFQYVRRKLWCSINSKPTVIRILKLTVRLLIAKILNNMGYAGALDNNNRVQISNCCITFIPLLNRNACNV